MSKKGTFAVVMSIAGRTLKNDPLSLTADADAGYEITLPAAKAGTLSTRTGDGEGILTLTEGHGLSSGNVVDIHWSGGCRYNVTLDSDDTTTVGFDDTPTASGDVLPAAETVIYVTTRTQINCAIDGDNVAMFGVNCDQNAHVLFEDADGDDIKAYRLTADNPETWNSSSGETNPLTGDPITVAYATNGSATASTLEILVLQDSTP